MRKVTITCRRPGREDVVIVMRDPTDREVDRVVRQCKAGMRVMVHHEGRAPISRVLKYGDGKTYNVRSLYGEVEGEIEVEETYD